MLNKGALAYFTREIAMRTVFEFQKKLYCCVVLTICLLLV